MLKALGATIANVTHKARQRGLGGDIVAADRAERIASAAERRRRLKTMLVMLGIFIALVGAFSTVFHELMDREGRSFSWATSVYWTLTTMTTLGFGDITFESDGGRIFSIVVLLTGSTFLLVMLPFVFIQFVFVPWMNERDRRRAPRSLSSSIADHVILTSRGPVEDSLIEKVQQAGIPYVLVVDDVDEAGRLHDEGRTVMVGELDDPTTYRNARVEQAAALITAQNDQTNTNIAFTVREIAPDVDIVASANSPDSVDILEIAGADHVVQLGEVLGAAMAHRAGGLSGRSDAIGSFGGLQIAEAGVMGTDLIGQTLAEAGLRRRFGVGIVGLWNRGVFEIATGDTRIAESSMLLLAATSEQLARFDEAYLADAPTTTSAVIIGGGRVGRAVGHALAAEGIEFAIVELSEERRRDGMRYVIGDAADRSILEEAGIGEASAVLITTHDDNVNVYLTRYCRGLRPDVRIVARSRQDRNVSTLYRAGADAVLSYAGIGSAGIWNLFRRDERLLIAQGLNVFRTPIPAELAGATLADAHVYRRTECNVVAVDTDGAIRANPDPNIPLPDRGELVLVGTDRAEALFAETFPLSRRRPLFTLERRTRRWSARHR